MEMSKPAEINGRLDIVLNIFKALANLCMSWFPHMQKDMLRLIALICPQRLGESPGCIKGYLVV